MLKSSTYKDIAGNCDAEKSDKTTITTTVDEHKKSRVLGTRGDQIDFLIENYVCVPLRPRSKVACIKWKTLDASPSHSVFIRKNIGIRTGLVSGLVVVDVDPPKDPGDLNGMTLYDKLLETHNSGFDLITPTCVTQSGGLHLYFAYDSDVCTTTKVNNYTIDIRGDGAYIVAPPSKGVNGDYMWKDDLSLSKLQPMVMPDWLKTWIVGEDQEVVRKVKTVKAVETPRDVKTARVSQPETVSNHIFLYTPDQIKAILDSLPEEWCDNYDKWLAITASLKSEGDVLKSVWDKWSRRSKSYDNDGNEQIWIGLVPNVDIGYLQLISDKTGNKKVKIRRTKYEKHFDTAPDTRIDSKYVKLDEKRIPKCLMVKSPCGTGKTTMTRNVVHAIRQQKPSSRFVSITCRRSLAYEHSRAFSKRGEKKIKMDIYDKLPISAINDSDNLIIQIDSLRKLNMSKWRGAIVYLDEVSTLLTYLLSSSTLSHNRRVIMNAFIRILVSAENVICTDADMNDACVSLMNRLQLDPHIIVNDYSPDTVDAVRYESSDNMIHHIEKKLLETDENLFVCFDTKKQMEVVIQRLKKFCEDNGLDKQKERFKVYSSEDGDKNELLDVAKYWKGNHVFFSPCITVGVNFDDIESRNVYLFSESCSVNSRTLIQMIRRCRNIENLHYYIKPRYAYCPESIDSVKRHYLDLANSYKTALDVDWDEGFHGRVKESDRLNDMEMTGIIELSDDGTEMIEGRMVFSDLYFTIAYYDMIYRSATKEQFEYMLRSCSFKIRDAEPVPDADDGVDERAGATADAEQAIRADLGEMTNRALNDKVDTLSDREKEIRKEIESRARVLGINMKHKAQRNKYRQFIETKRGFKIALGYKALMMGDEEIKKNITEENAGHFTAARYNGLFTKVRLIQRLEELLEVDTLDVDSKRDHNNFERTIDISSDLRASIIKSFNIDQNKKGIDKDNYGTWYIELCCMYRNLLGDDLIVSGRYKVNYKRFIRYGVDKAQLLIFNNLSNLR